jgi:hypothetical protein
VTRVGRGRLLFGTRESIAGTVYGTIMVMATLTAGAEAHPDAWRLAVLVFSTVLVLWFAHVYAHGLGESIGLGHRLDRVELIQVARRELSIVLAATGPLAALVLGAAGVIRETRAVWLALILCLVTLTVQGVRYAGIERLGRRGAVISVALNLALGLVIVALKAGLSH